MTNQDYNSITFSAKQICNSAMTEIYEIKKTNLSLHNRIQIERALAKLESLRLLLDIKVV